MEQRISNLVGTLNNYAHHYYTLDNPIVEDDVYNSLYKELLALEQANPNLILPHSPTQRVGDKISSDLEPVAHAIPMLSLDNAYTFDDMQKAFSRMYTQDGVTGELKLDGLAISLIYVNGLLTRAITRGDKVFGELVTAAVKTIKSVPLKLNTDNPPALFEARGEITLPFAAFEPCNVERVKEGKEPFKNPRNAAAGVIRRLDPKEVAKVPLSFYGYGIAQIEGYEVPTTNEGVTNLLHDFGFRTSPIFKTCNTAEDCKELYEHIATVREELDMPIDGVVFKTNNIADREVIGYTSKEPKWAVAWKFEAKTATTVIEDVLFSVGATGRITPVAKIKETDLDGSSIKSVTLHNQDEIDEKGFCIGDTIIIFKGGDIIPAARGRIAELCNPDNTPITIPKHCPSCGSDVVRKDGESLHYCTGGFTCPEQKVRTFQRFVSKKSMNIDGFGDKTVEEFIEKGLIHSLGDIFKLHEHREALMSLSGFGEKSVDKLLASIEAAKKPTLQRFIYALAIREIGESATTELCKHYSSLEDIFSATYEDILALDDFGDITASNLVDYFASAQGKTLISELLANGVEYVVPEKKTAEATPLTGRTFVVTGSFSVYPRKDIESKIKELGGKVSGSPSAKTSAVFVGKDAGAKQAKAQAIKGLLILSDEEIIKNVKQAGGLTEYLSSI